MDKPAWPFGDSEMRRLIRSHDWAATLLGRIKRWPARLRHATEGVLASPFPALVLWGPQSIQIYNDRHVELLGDRHPGALGRPALETWPELSNEILEARAILQAGGTVEYVNRRFDPLAAAGSASPRWLTGSWSAIRDRRGRILGTVISNVDTSSQVRAEEALRASETRQAYLVSLGDAIRPLVDPIAIQETATRHLRVELGADRVSYLEATEMDGLRVTAESASAELLSSVGRPWLLFSDPEEADALHAGDPTPCDDVETDDKLSARQRAGLADLGVHAFSAAPLVKSGKLVGILAAAFSRPHVWTAAEIHLLRVTADRTWAAVARVRAELALQDSEERLAMVLDSTDEGVEIIDREGRCTYRNPAGRRILGPLGLDPDARPARTVWEAHPDFVSAFIGAPLRRTMTLRQPSGGEFLHRPSGAEYRARFFPMIDGGVSVFFADVTERNAVRRQARDVAERQAFLLELSDALRPLTDPEAVKAEAARVLGERLKANRVGYAEALADGERVEITRHFVAGLDPIPGVFRLADYGEAFAKAIVFGQTSVRDDMTHASSLPDAERDAVTSLAIRASVSLPLMKSGKPVGILFVHSREPRTWTPLELELMQETAERTWDAVQRARAERALAESESRFRLFADASEDLLWIQNVDTRRYDYVSAGFRTVFGVTPSIDPGSVTSEDFLAYVHPDDVDSVRAGVGRVLEGEHQVLIYRFPPGDQGGDVRWIRDAVFPIRDPGGRITHLGGISQNVTEERKAAERMGVMIGELQHRTRNLLAVVRSIAEQTMAETGPTAAFQTTFGQRLAALSRAQGLLSRADQEPITIEALVRMELDALGAAGAFAERIRLKGPPARIRNRHVQTLALALHELATNARKYGALSGGDGRLDVAWSLDDVGGEGPRLLLEWTERVNGFAADSGDDRRNGYGRMLIERALPYALGAETAYAIDAGGVRCTINLPLEGSEEGEAAR